MSDQNHKDNPGLQLRYVFFRATDKMCILISKTLISSSKPMFDHLLESSHRDDSNKWSNIEFGEEIKQAVLIEVNFTILIWHSDFYFYNKS